MGPGDALKAINLIQPARVIPDHFGTWPVIDQDVIAWSSLVNENTDTECVVLKTGESVQL
jgi:L-ascorbate metabolism protein UlaG (beta-lactamase superfamily)